MRYGVVYYKVAKMSNEMNATDHKEYSLWSVNECKMEWTLEIHHNMGLDSWIYHVFFDGMMS
jgi:hypothetical protein